MGTWEIHSGICVKTLPKVYKPQERPWIKIGNAKSEELMNQINLCPSGALNYKNIKVTELTNFYKDPF